VKYNAIVDATYSGPAGEIINGTPVFSAIAQALVIIPEANAAPFLIFIKDGIYYEKLSIDKPNVHFTGESRDGTILRYDAHGDSRSPDGEPYGTRGSFTLRITAPGFQAANLTIENSFDYPGNAALTDDDPAKIRNPQAVAVFTSRDSDKAVFRNCVLRGYQDTLFTDAGRHYFYQCQILGHVDFIFGAGQAVFDECEIISRNRRQKNPTGYITAPSTKASMPFGFYFSNCRFLKETTDLPANSVRLGRPWHPNADSRVSGSIVFKNCFMDDHIGSEGYAPISSRDSTGQRIWYEVKDDSRFFEFGSIGPGALTSTSRPTLDSLAARWYHKSNVLNGWEPLAQSR
jgi:pectinesterase